MKKPQSSDQRGIGELLPRLSKKPHLRIYDVVACMNTTGLKRNGASPTPTHQPNAIPYAGSHSHQPCAIPYAGVHPHQPYAIPYAGCTMTQ